MTLKKHISPIIKMNDITDEHKKLTVVKCNELVEAGYKLSLSENRLLLICISRIDSTRELDIRDSFIINCQDIMGLTGVNKNTAYEGLKEGATRLFNREINIYRDGGSHLKMRWVSSVEYRNNAGEVELQFSQKISPYISELSRNFTKYKLANVMMFKSNYSIRVYELLMKWAGHTEVVQVEKIRWLFGLEDKYSKLNDFKKRVIDVAMKEINEFSDITASYTQIKRGRTITAFKFEWHPKKKALSKPKSGSNPSHDAINEYARINAKKTYGKSTQEVKKMMADDATLRKIEKKHGTDKSKSHTDGMQAMKDILSQMTLSD